jgi:hypothetical protein
MKRYLSLDFLRGLSIFGMVFSAVIPFGVLPAWMYHIQNPPPLHRLDTSISGIGWVDLVFPVFIFCMGVAIPLAGRRKIEQADGRKITYNLVTGILERFVMLWLFSYLYVFLNFSTAEGWFAQLATLLGFLFLFPLFYVFPRSVDKDVKLIVRAGGFLLVAGMIIFGHFRFGEVLSLYRGGIIIFLLAFLYLWGSLIWYFTRDSHRNRLVAFAVILLFAAVTMPFDLHSKLYAIEEIRWVFNTEYIYFLMILLPATYVGDLLYKKISVYKQYDAIALSGGNNVHTVMLSLISLGVVVMQIVLLYMGYYFVNLALVIVAGAVLVWLSQSRLTIYKNEILTAALLSLAGAVAVFAEGSVSKVPCTISYCLITASISIYLLVTADFLVYNLRNSFFVRIFTGAGSNPLMSYIAFGSLVMPLFKLTGLVVIYEAAYPEGYPWVGVLRAAVVVLFTMTVVARLSEKKIFWRA